MDKIILKDMIFFGYHGVLEEENRLGQRFIISAELYTDLKKAGVSDNVEDTVSYAEVYDVIKQQVEEKRYKLLEALAENLAAGILNGFARVNEVVITVKKPEAPVRGIFEYCGVEIRRKRIE